MTRQICFGLKKITNKFTDVFVYSTVKSDIVSSGYTCGIDKNYEFNAHKKKISKNCKHNYTWLQYNKAIFVIPYANK